MAKIAVGVDGSGSAVQAAVWAAKEAVLRRETLGLIHTYLVPLRGYPSFVATAEEVREGLREQGQEWLNEARDVVKQAVPGVQVETELREEEAIVALLQVSQEVRAIVVGSRGLGGFTGMLIGSVAVALVAHGHCPVVVVRQQQFDNVDDSGSIGSFREFPISLTDVRPVIIGMDGSAASNTALGFAFEEAALRNVPLVPVRTWNNTMFEWGWRRYRLGVDQDEIDRQERAALDNQLVVWRDRYPNVTVESTVVRGKVVRTLLEYSRSAQLIVVGSRGRGEVSGMLLGSTSQALIIHASCPVAVLGVGDSEVE